MTWSLWCLPSADTHSCLQTANSRKRGPAAPLIPALNQQRVRYMKRNLTPNTQKQPWQHPEEIASPLQHYCKEASAGRKWDVCMGFNWFFSGNKAPVELHSLVQHFPIYQTQPPPSGNFLRLDSLVFRRITGKTDQVSQPITIFDWLTEPFPSVKPGAYCYCSGSPNQGVRVDIHWRTREVQRQEYLQTKTGLHC